jgi:nucleoside 2-deoxyribosyltransferase
MKSIYLIGSLRNPKVIDFGNRLRAAGFDVFDDWCSPGPETDAFWMEYERSRGRTFAEALQGHHAKDVFRFDKSHLDRCDMAVMMLPTGKSGHLELGYTIGKGKPGFILMDGEPERYDIMYQFATGIFMKEEDLLAALKSTTPINKGVFLGEYSVLQP